MPRRQRDLDPAGGPTTELARELRALRARAGDPKFDTMARRTGRSKTALAEAAGGRRLPRWETVEDFVRACDADPASWRPRWEAARAEVGPRTSSPGTVPTPDGGDLPSTDLSARLDGPEEGADQPGLAADPTPEVAADRPVTTRPGARRARLAAVVAAALALVVLAAGVGFAAGQAGSDGDPSTWPLLRAVEVQNKVALGHDRLVEDRTPAYLSVLPIAYCASPSRSCKVTGTELATGAAVVANCSTRGQQMWNYDLAERAAADNPDRAASDLWYRVTFPDGRSGYLSEVYLTRSSRGGLGLPPCGPLPTPR